MGVCENQHFFLTLLHFCPDFYYFHRDFCHPKNVDVYSFLGGERGYQKEYGLYTHENVDVYTLFFGGRGSQKVYGLYTHENVDIYGRPLNKVIIWTLTNAGHNQQDAHLQEALHDSLLNETSK